MKYASFILTMFVLGFITGIVIDNSYKVNKIINKLNTIESHLLEAKEPIDYDTEKALNW